MNETNNANITVHADEASVDASRALSRRADSVFAKANEALRSQYATEVMGAFIGAGVVLAVVASRGRLTGLVEKAGLASARALGISEEFASAPESVDSLPSASFAARTGIRSAARAPGKWFNVGSFPGLDRNSEQFQRKISEKLGLDFEKMGQGKVAILHPRLKNPQKQLLGEATRPELGLWGSKEQGVGVVQYESLPSDRGYLKSADSVVRVTNRSSACLPVDFASQAGSGVLVGRPEQGLVLTNEHVVNSAATFSIETTTGQKFAARVVDIHPERDMAMLQITDAAPEASFRVATLGDDTLDMTYKKIGALGYHGALPGLVASPGRYEGYLGVHKLDIMTLDSMTKGGSGGGVFGQDGRLVSLVSRELRTTDQAVVQRSFVGGVNIKDIRAYIEKVNTMLGL